ncbi:GerAB/ArcD/ProY family transporter [Bacillus marinisedimentorum]|uniref:GerAB/ArcD/ProY family transporter n=1 Tax=Bacillus marinisedimentorum TaxID=1821260 RepID=UPI0007E0A96C|nr:GerAB/ArcD/ProY family transporter [Bacillus marinisedimentorum]
MREKESITRGQVFVLTLQTQIGIGILSLPHDVQEFAKGDGWLSVLLAGAAVQLIITIYWLLSKLYPKDTIFKIPERIFGKFAGKLFSVLYTFYFLLVANLILILFGRIIQRWVFPMTPSWIILLLFIGICSYLAYEDIHIIARFYSFSFILAVLLLFMVLPALNFVDYRFILPVGQSGITGIAKGINSSIIAMIGFEILLLALPMMKTKRKAYRVLLAGNLFVTLLYTFVVLIALMTFSPKEIEIIPEPVLYMLKAFEFKIIDRIDLLFLTVWIVSAATSFISYLYSSSVGLASLLHTQGHQKMVYVSWIPLIIYMFLPDDLISIDSYSNFLEKASYLFVLVIPTFLLISGLVKAKMMKKKGGGRYEV